MSFQIIPRWILLAAWFCAALGCQQERGYPDRPITLICPWAAGGGTDRVSRQIAVHLEKNLGVPVNVVNATGGKGVTGHSQGLSARPDGYTLTMATLELNMMHWSGLTDLTFHDCIPLMSVNEDYAALFVRSDSGWNDIAALESEIRSRPGSLKASGTASGGAWHLALAGWLSSQSLSPEDVIWISSTGAGPSLQELISGGLDMVCCSLPEASSLLQSGEVRALGVMSPQRAAGYGDVPTFREQGTDWTLGGWRGIAVPKETPEAIVDKLVTSLTQIVNGETTIELKTTRDGQPVTTMSTFPEFMAIEGFDATARPPNEFVRFLEENDEKFGALLTSEAMRSVNRDRYNPMVFPFCLMGLLCASLLGCALTHSRTPLPDSSNGSESNAAESLPSSVRTRGIINLGVVVVAIMIYLVFAEMVGFVILGFVLMFCILLQLGNRAFSSILVAIVFVPLLYHTFTHLLRVPLPRGWLGW